MPAGTSGVRIGRLALAARAPLFRAPKATTGAEATDAGCRAAREERSAEDRRFSDGTFAATGILPRGGGGGGALGNGGGRPASRRGAGGSRPAGARYQPELPRPQR